VRSGTVVGRWGAPTDVAQFGDHYMLMLRDVSPGTMCISTAAAGPYIAAAVPFICQQSLGGSIDPRVFVDASGQPYMIWKSEQNARSYSVDTQIWSQPLSADGMHLLGQPTVIFGPTSHGRATSSKRPR